MTIRLASRASALAMAQAEQFVTTLKSVHPELDVAIVPVTSLAGDKDKETPLAAMGQIGLFSKEIDEIVLADGADCALHCLKDLGTERPEGLITAAILKRFSPHDVLICKKDFFDRLSRQEPLTLGTSSPRRAELVPPCLQTLFGTDTNNITFKTIRGNIDTRLNKLIAGDFDAIVLAFAGLARLFRSKDGRERLTPIMKQLNMTLLPLTLVAGAPGQGALCLEQHHDKTALRDLLHATHDTQTALLTTLERKILKEYGGGCHERFGVTALMLQHIKDPYVIIRGKTKHGTDITQTRCPYLAELPRPVTKNELFCSDEMRDHFIADETEIALAETAIARIKKAKAIFIANARAVTETVLPLLHGKFLFTSGIKAWQSLSQRGLQIHGCADGFGFSFLQDILDEPVMGLPPLSERHAWLALTHEGATKTWTDIDVMATYQMQTKTSFAAEFLDKLKNYKFFYWAAASHYQILAPYLPKDAIHYCGIGKTATILTSEIAEQLYIVPNKEFLCPQPQSAQKDRQHGG